MVIETDRLEHTLVGILHGGRLKNCTPDPGSDQKIPGLFANLEHEENMDFIKKWLPLGEYFALKNESDTDMFYLENLDHQRKHYLWHYYPFDFNDKVYNKIFFDVFNTTTVGNERSEAYGMDCSQYNSKVLEICTNGDSELENFEYYNVNCSSKNYNIRVCTF